MHDHINSELLSADARGRKTIPFAVFAVIFIHIVLFLVLLIAAGCRAKARAKRNSGRPQEVVKIETNAVPLSSNVILTNSAPPITHSQPVLVGEPEFEEVLSAASAREEISSARATTVFRPQMHLHVVQPGDSISKIARQYGMTIQAVKAENNLKSNIIRVGQKLRVGKEKTRRPKDTLAAL